MKILKKTLIYIALIFTSLSALAHEYKINSLIIDHPIARETPPGVKVGAGYLTITNNGKEDDKLISVTGDVSPLIQIHTMSIEDNVMKMQEVKGGLEIPAGKSVQLQAGGKHIMFMNLPKQLKAGDKHKAILVFEKAGEIEITFNVEKHEVKEQMKHGDHKQVMKMDHKKKGKHHKHN